MKAVQLPTHGIGTRVVRGYAFALAAAMSYGASNVITRHAVTELAPPLAGSAIALAWGTLFIFMTQARVMRWSGPRIMNSLLFFAVSGIFASLGFLFSVFALKEAPVVLVTPVTSTHPLFTLLFAALLLRGLERVTPRLFLGAALVVLGVAVLTLADALD